LQTISLWSKTVSALPIAWFVFTNIEHLFVHIITTSNVIAPLQHFKTAIFVTLYRETKMLQWIFNKQYNLNTDTNAEYSHNRALCKNTSMSLVRIAESWATAHLPKNCLSLISHCTYLSYFKNQLIHRK
jgi:hypothetical protein